MKIIFSLLPLLVMAVTAAAADSKPPNIVLILSDDQSYTDYGFMGHPEIETPNLDKLARESVLFRRGYVPTALCRPALMTLVTGLYSHQNKTTGNDPANTPANRAHTQKAGNDSRELLISHIDKTVALPQWLAKKGYVSHQSGKWWEGSFQRGGFTEGMTKGFPNPGGRHGDAGLKIGRDGIQPVTDFIDRSVAAEKPFFVWYAPFMPHTPHTPPDRLFDKYVAKGVQPRIAKYYAMCEWFDETCGALVNHIDESGIAENTLVVYVTDNGWVQTEGGSYAPRSKRSPNELGTRTPIMFRWPGTIPPADRPELCSSIDFVPTVLAAAGADGPHEFPGLNLLPQLKTGQAIDRDTLFGESFAHDIADIENPQASLLYRWVIHGHDKLLLTYDGAPGKMKYPPQSGEPQLFDLKSDPGEKVNLANKNPDRVNQLSALLDKWYVPNDRQVGKFTPVAPKQDRKHKNLSEVNNEQLTEADSEILFTRRIAPLLREKCLGCHGNNPDEIEGGFDVRSLETLAVGGDSEDPGVVPGKPEASSIYLAAQREEDLFSAMPPKEAEKLSGEQLTWLHDWIKSGAKWPSKQRQEAIRKKYADAWSVEDGIAVKTSGGLSPDWTHRKYDPDGLWAYQPVKPPNLGNHDRNPIDVLIERALPDGLSVAPRADRRTLIRRATFDLTGLPPAPAEVRAFLNDQKSDREAFAGVVDRLLESPRYGERMAQHWLDVVRYADSSGFANDFERGNAWRYRDYVVRAFNADMPYNDFVRQQIAGDELDPSDPEKIVATGFLRMGPWELTGMEVAKVARQRFLDDVTNSVGETFLAHSLQCARCHDHKFDPVPTRDYYSMQAVFATTQLAERKAEFVGQENTALFEEQSYLRKSLQTHQQTLDDLDRVLLENAEKWFAEQRSPISAAKEQWEMAIDQLKASGRKSRLFNAARSAMRKAGVPEQGYPPKLVGFTPQQFGRERVARKGLQRLRWELERYEPFALAVYHGRTPDVRSVPAPVRVPADRLERGELEQTAILSGGDPFSPADPVAPGTLSAIDDQISIDIPTDIAGRRSALASWIADPNNPLTTRVIVNRLWQWHFGKAVAGNPNNFGSTGKRPTHPKLLDWLAATFVDEGWSIKTMHRRMMTSDTYCRSGRHLKPKLVRQLDPEGVSYAAFQPRRLSAEELRDSMLAASGELNATLGGIPCRAEINQEIAFQPRQVMGTFAAAWTPNPLPKQRNRRSLYVLRLRGLIDPMLEVFNTPAPDFSCEKRESSTVTPQVFSLFNGQNTHTRALTLAARVLKEADNDRDAIKQCFQLTLSREPSSRELHEFLTHWRETEQSLPVKAPARTAPPLEVVREAVEENTGEKFTFLERLYSNADFVPDLQPADVDRHTRALSDLCLVILNSNEFVYVY